MLSVVIPFLVAGLTVLGSSVEQPPWWLDQHRMIQTNLREIDATMDLTGYADELKASGADVVLFNVGGIVANYPTELQYHYRNPLMKGDMTGEVISLLHKRGIRMIGRFDFSKINETLAADNPDWLYVSTAGKNVNYNGQVHTCVMGGYQQDYMFKILGEAIDRYPLDGIFFNAIGFQKSDYSDNYHGICQCKNCKSQFREYSQMELPTQENPSDPAFKKYQEFTTAMKDRQFLRVRDFVKAKRPDIAICTYTEQGVDVIRKESNRPLSEGTYMDTERAKWTLLTCGQRQLANAAVHFLDIPWRHSAVSPYLTSRRLWQQTTNGAWLDFYCIGPLGRQEDRSGLDIMKDIYRLHADNEQFLSHTVSAAQIGLVRRGDDEYKGILQILSENHLPFEFVQIEPGQLARYKAVIVPDAGEISPSQAAVLDEYARAGGKVLLTGRIPESMKSFAGTRYISSRPAEKSAYIRIRDLDKKAIAPDRLNPFDLVFLDGVFSVYETDKTIEGMLRLIPADMFGPPEKCYYRTVSDTPALLYTPFGKGAAACFTFGIGSHYARQAHEAHAALLTGAIASVLNAPLRLNVHTSPLVEIAHRKDPAGQFEWVSLYNHTGQRENAIHSPVPVSGIDITLAVDKKIKQVRSLKNKTKLPFKQTKDSISLSNYTLNHYDIIVVEYR